MSLWLMQGTFGLGRHRGALDWGEPLSTGVELMAAVVLDLTLHAGGLR
jgi:hypothetical protein